MMVKSLVYKTFKHFSLAALLLSNVGFGQTTEALEAYKLKYPGQHIIQTKSEQIITITLVKNKPVVSHFYNSELLVLDKSKANALSSSSIDFSSFEKITDIVAYSLVPEGKKSKKIVATNFITQDAETEGSVFHDGGKVTNFFFPGVEEGTLRHISYTSEVSDHFFPFGYSFYSFYPSENSSVKIITDSAIHIQSKAFNFDKIQVNYTEKLEGKKRIYTWSLPQELELKKEDNSPSSRYYAPHILAQISHYYIKGERQNVLGSVSDLHKHYLSNVAEIENEKISPELSKIADSLTHNLTSNYDKAKAVYYWVQDNIKYIAFEEGEGGFVPRQASSVYEKRFGDCKDMASLIYCMLKTAGVPSYLTWIGSRDLPYKYTDMAGSFCDNHMITTFKDNGKYYFLDATNSFQTIESPTGFIQGKQALVHINKDEFDVIDVPVQPTQFTRMIDSSYVSIEDRNLIGHSKTTISGYYHVTIGNYAKQILPKEMDKLFTSLNAKGNNSFSATNSKFEAIENRDTDANMTYDWKVSNYATTLDKEIYLNLILEKDFVSQGELKPTRIAPFELENKSDDLYTVMLSIPKGYTVKTLPENVKYKSDFAAFDVTYKLRENVIYMDLHLKLDFLLLQPNQFEEWNAFLKTKKTAISESIVLKKI